ncbi:hypothetical protein L226DRAFT_533396 [Lentinus tigrinus ALCF2SS1-7]|uniref:uncharacterized protein n=1 Tax=Lentinus tigrinus ALCF2SS1-7 TaxID=1328758 RepID=UPI0011661346|nr:hypothetical protein L226DRAFT_533396 [Lentinus tigrinus ALCF2SS1-7]
MPPCKKNKAAATTEPSGTEERRIIRRRTRGSLQDLPDFAVEIQLEVFSNLHPRDLLNLARTCKRFREFFLHPSNERLWTAARESVEDLPERPPFLSEPAFVNLLFFTHCHSCGKPNIRKIIWQWFVRYCPGCVTSMSYHYCETEDKINDQALHLPNRLTLFSKCDLDDVFGMYITKSSYSMRRINPFTSKYFRFHKRDVVPFLNELGGSTCETASTLVQRRKRDFAERMKHARRCQNWYDHQHEVWMAGLDTKREQRFEEIVHRLRDMGWDEEIEYLGEEGLEEMASLPVVAQSSKLTPKNWEKVLYAVQDFLENTRKQRLSEARTEVLRSRFLDLKEALLSHYVQLPRIPIMDCRPDDVDFAMMDECKAVADAPTSATVTREDFADIIPNIASRWEEQRKIEHREAIRKCIGSIAEDAESLTLAVAIFPCVMCSRGTQPLAFYHWPDVLAHPCGRMRGNVFMFIEGGAIDWEQAVYNVAACRNDSSYWNCRFPYALKNLYGSEANLERAVKNMRGIVEALGLDPEHATVDDLRKCEGRVRCVQCSSHDLMEDCQDMVYTWEAAFAHAWSKKSLIEHNQWESVGADDMKIVTKLEKSGHDEFPSLWIPGSVWVCSLCVDWDGKGEDVVLHLLTSHDLKVFSLGETIYLHPGKSMGVVRPPVVFPY